MLAARKAMLRNPRKKRLTASQSPVQRRATHLFARGNKTMLRRPIKRKGSAFIVSAFDKSAWRTIGTFANRDRAIQYAKSLHKYLKKPVRVTK